ncbi:SRPBCC family protein [uncultured Pontibacter sp.]|uniref:SRPBCC family protein n=1 Tax=uncultured Pontibacter sp. TaxID=453356 RepID=UPI00263662C1|nr:SRPBCC family protein [uncultured Pontibacter sp.]
MYVLKKFGVSLLGLMVVLLLVAFFLPSKVTIERRAVLKAPATTVFDQVNRLQNWEKWSPWHTIDPHMLLSYEGPIAGKGAKYNWFSKHPDVGSGSLTITNSKPYQRIDTKLKFEGQNDGFAYYTFEETPEGTVVTWAMEAETGSNPVHKYFGLLLDPMLGPSFEKGLENLRKIVEKPTAVR